MKVVRLTISNFRGIKSAELLFDGHTLMVGSNNVGKSTLCEALDLVLGPDRLNRFPEPPRELRRHQLLRRWSHEQVTEVLPGSPRTRRAHGAGAPSRLPIAVGSH